MRPFHCSVISCVRTLEGPKNPSSFLIERTCRYAKTGECNLGNRAPKKYMRITTYKATITDNPKNQSPIEPMFTKVE